ncbi:hypothetical protein RND81_01G174800 [Saponaria officinalis]|uniref:VQ domain-containing protein n=1 Tax=Saponaria officinalis TaxID=3572 RepID=A0AAW1NJE4_SAPOF
MDNPPPPQPDPTHSSTTSTTTATNNHPNNNRDQFLRHLTHLNKLSHKISKPSHRTSEPPVQLPPPPPPPQQQPQPPVYNISKTDFRDVVQKLTGSPAHAPPTLHAPKPNSSRLQRIRPPPLAPLLNTARHSGSGSGFGSGLGPMSPLPPLPSCHGAAESPISAYMRFLNSAMNNSAGMMFPPPEDLENYPPSPKFIAGESSSSAAMMMPPPPSSPLSFGCLPSPKLLLPLSPTVPGVPSPK